MKETENKKLKFKPIEIQTLDRVGIKLNSEMVKLLSDRIKQAEISKRGVNILIKGDIKRGFGEIISNQGEEISHTIYADGEITIFNWDPEKAYNGKHKFWLEGFIKK